MKDITKLQNIQNRWGSLSKEAGILKDITDTSKTVTETVWDKLLVPHILSVPALAILGGLAYNSITRPKALSEAADKLALQNALDTEIAIARREIADKEEKNSREENSKKYDRFI